MFKDTGTYTNFKVPDEKSRARAIGSLAGTPILMKKALNVIIPKFKPIDPPGPDDWLASHDEDGQIYEIYKIMPINWIGPPRDKIYIMVMEPEVSKTFIERLEKICKAFYYGITVKVIVSKEKLSDMGIDSRINEYTNKIQYNARQILSKLEKTLPKDAYCLIGALMSDIYPKDDWNFVFGIASIKDRTGVFSFARYDENFFLEKISKPIDENLIVKRAGKVMCHEIGHMFGIRHCIYFSCLMNGSNHLEESVKKPMDFCPVCIRKLQENVKFPMLERYEALLKVCAESGDHFVKEKEFFEGIVYELNKSLDKFKPQKTKEI